MGGTAVLHPSAPVAIVSASGRCLSLCGRVVAPHGLAHGCRDGCCALLGQHGFALFRGGFACHLLTGALHEDGLADFFDGFGGGRGDRQRILAIMKDSHIGTYGVLSLILYVALLFFCLNSMGPVYAAFSILAIDPYAKMVAAQVVQMMPYARAEAEAKSGVTYRHYGVASGIWLAIQGLLPMGVYLWLMSGTVRWEVLIFVPWLVMYILYRYIWHRLRGYTGDCCGAMFLLVELSAYLVVAASLSHCFAQ